MWILGWLPLATLKVIAPFYGDFTLSIQDLKYKFQVLNVCKLNSVDFRVVTAGYT